MMSLYDELAVTPEAPFKGECGGLWFQGQMLAVADLGLLR